MSICLKCVSCCEKSKGRYEVRLETIPASKDANAVVIMQCPAVPGTTYELLLKGLWPQEGEDRQFKCLLPPLEWGSVGTLKECTLEEQLKAGLPNPYA